MRRAGLLLAAGAAGLALVPPAHAGSYDVVSCDAAPGAANHAWVGTGDPSPHYEVDQICPSASDPERGLRVWDQIGSANAPNGSAALWTFGAPASMTITKWRYKRWLGKDGTNSWDVHARLGDGTTLDSCTIPFGLPSCEVGAPAGSNQANERTASSLSTDSLTFGVTCAAGAGSTCATGGATIHRVWAHLYSSTVTLAESTDPVVAAPTGSLLGGGWRSGTQTVEVSASDGVGVSETRVYVDGTLRSDIARTCDFTYSLPCVTPPCSPAAGGTCGDKSAAAAHSLDTKQLPDGERQVEVAAVDAAGNEARSAPVSVRVDNTAPSFAISAPNGETTVEDLSVTWSSGDGTGAGVAGQDIEVSIDGGAWQPWLTGTGATSATYSGSAGHTYRFRGRAGDATGLTSDWVASGTASVVEPFACACPGPPADPPPSQDPPAGTNPPGGTEGPPAVSRRTPSLRVRRVRRVGRRIVVAGMISRGASGKVLISFSARVGERRVRVRRRAVLRRGRFSTSVRLSRRVGNAAGLLTVAYSGDVRFRPRTVRTRRIG